ncbi:hypothetical protein KM043_011065 [Ampulex compressa]|nr:hypothetical protein KM043_011065 [Ampulex compressa]
MRHPNHREARHPSSFLEEIEPLRWLKSTGRGRVRHAREPLSPRLWQQQQQQPTVAQPPRRRDTPKRPCHREPFGLGSVSNSGEKVEGPGTQGAKESVNDSKDEDGPDVVSTLSGLLAGLPALAGRQRLANSLRQKFASNSGKSTHFPWPTAFPFRRLVTVVDEVINLRGRN